MKAAHQTEMCLNKALSHNKAAAEIMLPSKRWWWWGVCVVAAERGGKEDQEENQMSLDSGGRAVTQTTVETKLSSKYEAVIVTAGIFPFKKEGRKLNLKQPCPRPKFQP